MAGVVAVSVFGAWGLPVVSGAGASPAASDAVSVAATADRVAGGDRYQTAVEVARQVGGGSLTGLTRIIVVTGEAFPDGLTASGLAGYLDNGGRTGRTAILLTRTADLPEVTAQAIRASGVPANRVFVVGGTSAVSDAVYAAIARAAGWTGQGANPVTRISGADRYGTAAAIVAYVMQVAGGGLPSSYRTVLVANGVNFPDALAGGTLAYRNGHLIVLSPSPSAPRVSLDAVSALTANCSILLGGQSAVSAQVSAQVQAVLVPGGCGASRIGGATRYETAALIANRFVQSNGPAQSVLLVSGETFPDALASAPLAGVDRPMLLTAPNRLSPATNAWLLANRNTVTQIMVIGGSNAVEPSTAAAAANAATPTSSTTTTPSSSTTTTTTVPGPTTTTTTTSTTSTTTTTVPGPTGSWPVKAGGNAGDDAYAISPLPASAGAIVSGEFTGTAQFGTTTLESTLDGGNPTVDSFVAKVDGTGNWVWAVAAGGTGTDRARSVATLSDGSALVTGSFFDDITFTETVSGTPITIAATNPNDYLNEIFVAKVDAAGKWEWAVRAGGTGQDYGDGITALSDGSAIVTGGFAGTANFGSASVTSSGDLDVFVAKIDASGNWVWASRAGAGGGGDPADTGLAVTALADGSAIVTGEFTGTTTFTPTVSGLVELTSAGGYSDAFVAKIDASGNWVWAARAGGADQYASDSGSGVSVLADGSAIVTGHFTDVVTFTPAASGSISLTAAGDPENADVFVGKVNTSGEWVWVVRAGGTNDDLGLSVETLSDGSSIVSGAFRSTTAEFGSTTLTKVGGWNLFVAKVDANGSWIWASGAGGTGANARGNGVTVLDDGKILVTGNFDMTVAFGTSSLTSTDDTEDVFVARLSNTGTFG